MYRRWEELAGKGNKKSKKKATENEQRLPIIINNYPPGVGINTVAPSGYELRLSPPVIPGRDFDNLYRYLDWLENKGSILPTAKATARTSLEELGFGYSVLHKVREDEWVGMGVKRGAVLAILDNQKAWAAFLTAEEVAAARSQAVFRLRVVEEVEQGITIDLLSDGE